MQEHDAAPGWEAIDRALAGVYGSAEPIHWGTIVKWRLGGPDPLDGISAYDAGDHWHFISFGMTELYEKETEDPEESGFGFEFTFRLKKQGDEPPVWAAALLQNLARYVWQTGNVFAPGHTMPLNGPIAVDEETVIHAILFVDDPGLPGIDTPHGRVRFLQIVGLSNEERLDAAAWNAMGVARLLQEYDARWITDLGRESKHADPSFRQAVDEGLASEGSSAAITYVPELDWELVGGQVALTIGAIVVPQLKRVLPGRLLFGQSQMWVADGRHVALRPGESASATSTDESLLLELPEDLVRRIADGLQPRAGRYDFDEITIFVNATEIRAPDGSLVEVIG